MNTKKLHFEFSSDSATSAHTLWPQAHDGRTYVNNHARQALIDAFADQTYWLHRVLLTEDQIREKLRQSEEATEKIVKEAKLDLAKQYRAHAKYCIEQATKAIGTYTAVLSMYEQGLLDE